MKIWNRNKLGELNKAEFFAAHSRAGECDHSSGLALRASQVPKNPSSSAPCFTSLVASNLTPKLVS